MTPRRLCSTGSRSSFGSIFSFWGCHERAELLVFERPPARQADAAPRLPGTIRGNGRARDAVNGGRATAVRRIFHVRSDRWPKWACRRAPTKEGALLERWRAQCGTTRSTITYRRRRIRVLAAPASDTASLDARAAFTRPSAPKMTRGSRASTFGRTHDSATPSPRSESSPACRLFCLDRTGSWWAA